jgi:tetratricopeptide (TPR) repeat protein
MKWWVVGMTALAAIVATAPRAVAQRAFIPPNCDLPKGHYLVNSAVLYLKSAAETRFPDEQVRDLNDANRVLLEALQKGQEQNGAVWYFLGRYYEAKRDVPGADSAFKRARQLAPQCTADIDAHRRRMWVPILNSAVDQIRANDPEAAKETLRRANALYDAEPTGFYYMFQIFANASQRDSAIYYLERALRLATDSANVGNSSFADIRDGAAFNLATLFNMEDKPDSAVYWYQRYREKNPNDPKAVAELASMLDRAGRQAEALALYDSVLMRADSMPTIDLFTTGVAMFRAHRLQRAAEAFEKGLTRNPYYRDALYNLANTYLAMAEEADSTTPKADLPKVQRDLGDKMTPIAQRLVATDPWNTMSLRLLARSYQLRGKSDSTLSILQRIDTLPADITVSSFAPTTGDVWELHGVIANSKSEPVTIPAITFEFLNDQGEVVRTLTVDSRTIAGDGMAAFDLTPEGAGIAAWRYHVGS